MSRIFLSHSSENNAEAIALRDWLASEGWDDVFLDLDPERGIQAGERWQEALKRSASRCELVIFLVSPEWAASKWCLAEFLLAHQLNKRIFGVVVRKTPFDTIPIEMTVEWQVTDLVEGRERRVFEVRLPPDDMPVRVEFDEGGLKRLKLGLQKAGLDARYFLWPPADDPDRAPYRGLKPLEASDAGIFFGREGPIVEITDRLRGLGAKALPRMLVILGASGAGKSSFLRAGLLPRLAREAGRFCPLPVIRPYSAAMEGDAGFIVALERALTRSVQPRSRADIRAACKAGGAALRDLLRPLSEPAAEGEARPILVLAIDQGEELFQSEGAQESLLFLERLLELLHQDDPAVIAIVTIRSDSYEALQAAQVLEGIQQETWSLPPMPKGTYRDVILGPARRLAGSDRTLEVEEQLVDALLADIETGGAKDALPLLAFSLERLWREHGGDGHLGPEDYRALGGVRGSINAGVTEALKAADKDSTIPRDEAARLKLLRRGLIPWLAGIDPESGAPRRRVARLSEIPEEARPLINLLVEQHLLATDVSESGETTVEPAHEALLRQWGLLEGWLEEDFEDLATAEGVRRAARDWAANDGDPDWLSHTGGRLDLAEQVADRTDFATFFEPGEREYLAAARETEETRKAEEAARREREHQRELEIAQQRETVAKERESAARRIAKRTTAGLFAATTLLLAALGFAWWGFDQKIEAERRAARLSIGVAFEQLEAGAVQQSLRTLLSAAEHFTEETVPDRLLIAFDRALRRAAQEDSFLVPSGARPFEMSGRIFFQLAETHDVYEISEEGEPSFYAQFPGRFLKYTKFHGLGGDDSRSISVVQLSNDYGMSIHAIDLQNGTLSELARFNVGTGANLWSSIGPDGIALIKEVREKKSNTSNGYSVTWNLVRTVLIDLHQSVSIEIPIGSGMTSRSDFWVMDDGRSALFVDDLTGLSSDLRVAIEEIGIRLIEKPDDGLLDNCREALVHDGAPAALVDAYREQVFSGGWDITFCGISLPFILHINRFDASTGSHFSHALYRYKPTGVGDSFKWSRIPDYEFSADPNENYLSDISSDGSNQTVLAVKVQDVTLTKFERGQEAGERIVRMPAAIDFASLISPRTAVVFLEPNPMGYREVRRIRSDEKSDYGVSKLVWSDADTFSPDFRKTMIAEQLCIGTPQIDELYQPDTVFAFTEDRGEQRSLRYLSGGKVRELILPDDAANEGNCLTLHPDGAWYLLKRASAIELYDAGGKNHGTLPILNDEDGGVEVSFLPGPQPRLLSGSGSSIVEYSRTLSGDWESKVIHEGEYQISRVNADATGKRLVYTEIRAFGVFYGLVRSIGDGTVWRELGSGYQTFGFAVLADNRIAAGRLNPVEIYRLHTLYEAVDAAVRVLSRGCEENDTCINGRKIYGVEKR